MSTKKLAKELGLLRKRSQSSGTKKSLVSNQMFSYLIVIDFESTCWREKNNYGQEIIEFPAVLLNTSTGEVESEFHTYVQPQEHPILSEFCTELTGITQRQVEAGVPLHICLSRFSRWLQTLQLQRDVIFPGEQRGSTPSISQKPCAFLTWSDWDLGVCLQYECKRKQLHKPRVLNSWIDLRATYRLFYNRKPKGLNGALQDLGIQFSGREHSGLDDARNTAQLAVRMMRDGCVMKVTRSQERAPLMSKPLFRNANIHASNKKEKRNTATEEKVLSTINTSPSKTPPNSCGRKSCSKNIYTKENSNSVQEPVQGYQSLISPRTLLNGITAPLLGSSSSWSVKEKTVTNLFCPILINTPSPRSNNNNLVLCSTTVACLSPLPQPNQTFELEAANEKEDIVVEIDEGRGSYDNLVLEGDDVITDLYEEDGRVDIKEMSDRDREYSLPEEAKMSHSVTGQTKLMSNYNMTKTPGIEIKSKTPKLEKNESSDTSIYTSETRLHSNVSLPGTSFAMPKNVTWDSKSLVCRSKQHIGIVDKVTLRVQDESKAPHENSKTFNASFNTDKGLRPCVPEKSSVHNASFVKPKSVITQHNSTGTYSKKTKENVKTTFSIYTDSARCSSASSHPPASVSFCIPQRVVSSSSTNPPSVLSSLSTNHSSVLLTSRRGVSKITSPLCACGRRAKRQTVANGGPNHGRGFYCCPVRRSGTGTRIQKGCEFFKWESALIKANSPAIPAAGSSVSLCLNSSLRLRPPQSSSRKSY